MPFYPSPDRDDGYDITDFSGVDSRLGNHGELVEVIRTAHDRGIKVIADLIVNHTSDQHPWFRTSRRSTTNPYRDCYVWRDTPPGDTSDEVVFPDQEDSIWEKDERTGEWYLHNFRQAPARPQPRQPRGRRRTPADHRLLARAELDGFRVDGPPFIGQNQKNQHVDRDDVADRPRRPEGVLPEGILQSRDGSARRAPLQSSRRSAGIGDDPDRSRGDQHVIDSSAYQAASGKGPAAFALEVPVTFSRAS